MPQKSTVLVIGKSVAQLHPSSSFSPPILLSFLLVYRRIITSKVEIE